MGELDRNHASHTRGLWGVCWRMFLLTPIALLGLVVFAFVICLSFFPPAYAVIALVGGDYLMALLSLAIWLVWLKFGKPIRRFTYVGFEHGGV